MPNIHRTRQMGSCVQGQSKSGAYANLSEVGRAGIRLLMERDGARQFYALRAHLEEAVGQAETGGFEEFEPLSYQPDARCSRTLVAENKRARDTADRRRDDGRRTDGPRITGRGASRHLRRESRHAMNIMVRAILIGVLAATSLTVQAEWAAGRCKADPITDETSCWAHSASVALPGPFPYRDRHASIGVGCNSRAHLWTYITISPMNLTGGQWNYGATRHTLDARWDQGPPSTFSAVEAPDGENFLHIDDDWSFIKRLKTYNRLRVRFYFWQEGPKVAEWSLAGSKAAIDTALKRCGVQTGIEPPKDAATQETVGAGRTGYVAQIKNKIERKGSRQNKLAVLAVCVMVPFYGKRHDRNGAGEIRRTQAFP